MPSSITKMYFCYLPNYRTMRICNIVLTINAFLILNSLIILAHTTHLISIMPINEQLCLAERKHHGAACRIWLSSLWSSQQSSRNYGYNDLINALMRKKSDIYYAVTQDFAGIIYTWQANEAVQN